MPDNTLERWHLHPSGNPNTLGEYTVFHGFHEGRDNQVCSASLGRARLIAAAPELLSACKDALHLFQYASFDNGVHSPSGDSEGEHWGRLCREQLEKAIAKATTTEDAS